MVEVIPAILTDEVSFLRQRVDEAEGVVDRIHVDIIDKNYSDNVTVEPQVMSDIDTNLNIDFHLMVNEPINWISRCVDGGADRIIGHVEFMDNQAEYVEACGEAGVGVGLALDMDAYPERINESVLENVDVVLVMSVLAGYGGQEFNKEAFDKIEELDRLRREKNYHYLICDDGGVAIDNVDRLAFEGADQVCIGNRIFEGDLETNIREYQKKQN